MRCFNCDIDIEEDERYIYCTNCGNEFCLDCINVDDDCPVCEAEGSLELVDDEINL